MTQAFILDRVSVSLKDYERRFTLSVPELVVRSGEVIGLTGPSGTGKTLLLETLGLLRRPSSAENFHIKSDHGTLNLASVWDGIDKSPPDVRASMFGFVPQSGGLLPFLSIEDNVVLSQRISGRVEPDWCQELLARMGILDIAGLFPSALSIGQRQRAAICRALAHRPAFVIADEPTAALDPEAAHKAMGLLIETASLGGAGVIISSHDLTLLDAFPMRRTCLSIVSPPGSNNVVSQLDVSLEAEQ